ncbi:hypothetical protein ACQY0O_001215 [Thecaphora frezii]
MADADTATALPPAPSASDVKPRASRTFTRAQLAQRIAQGETLVFHHRKVYKLDRWLQHHPGGELAILHFVGRDASDEIDAYHSDHTLNVLMSRFVIGYLDEQEWHSYRPLVPPVQLGYRRGRLDHPHAQINMWTRGATSASAAAPEKPQATRTPSEDEKVRPVGHDGGDNEDEDTDEVVKLLGLQQTQKGRKRVAKPVTFNVSRPQTFPLPVESLEPPPDPPSIDPARERKISEAYRKMHAQIKAAGLYELRPAGYAHECFRYTALSAMAWWFFARGQAQFALERAAEEKVAGSAGSPIFLGSTLSFLLSSVFLGLFWHQLTFSAHDAGHCGITHSHTVDRLIGTVIADFIGGLSIGWWCDNHDVHHLVTNHPEHDPDIQHMPFFAISPKFVLAGESSYVLESTAPSSDSADGASGKEGRQEQAQTQAATSRPRGLWSSYYRRVLEFDAASRFFLRFQHKLYYVVMSLARFNLYANSYGFLALKARRDAWLALEAMGLVTFWTWYGYGVLGSLPTWGLRVSYLLISHIVTSPLHVQIVLSHFAQSCDDLGLSESFASRQIRTTMDVECPEWLEFVHGGLHMQVSHHLFPRIPRHNLREVRDRFVRPFCEEMGLGYEEYGFVKGNGKVRDTLRSVAAQVDVLAKVASARARGELE